MTKILILIPTLHEYNGIFSDHTTKELLLTHGAEVRLCGIGPAASAFLAGQLCHAFSPEKVLLCGIAGAFTQSGLATGDIVSVRDETFADLGFSENGMPVNFDEIGVPLYTRSSGQDVSCRYELSSIPNFKQVSALTVSCVTSESSRAEYLEKHYDAQIENMEGASVVMACEHLGIPVTEMRTISNYVGERDKGSWDVKGALKSMQTAFPQIISHVSGSAQ